jgi:flavodoxin
MTGVVVYESYYGNTKMLAEAIAGQLEADGCEAELRNVRKHYPEILQGDLLFLGSPIRMGSVSGRVKRFVKKLDKNVWKDKPIVVFTTTLMLPKDATDKQKKSQEKWDRSAGPRLGDLAKSRGLNALENCLWVEVKGIKGPLVETGVETAKQFAHDILLSLKD